MNRNVAEIINSLFIEFIGKVFNLKSDGIEVTLFSIDFEANNAKCHIKLDISHKGDRNGFNESLGWRKTRTGIDFGSKDNQNLNNFYVFWNFFNEKTKKQEIFDENKHLKDGYFGKVKKATLDNEDIDIDKFKSEYRDFKFTVQIIMNQILQEFAGMIKDPRNDNCTGFLEKFHNLWDKSHLFYDSIKK